MKKVFKITIAYMGTNYHGWQKQINAHTIEDALIDSCHKLFKDIVIKGASRTDAGVHALGQVATIETETTMDAERLVYALNAHLPRDIVIQDAYEVDASFHPRFHALEKTYLYQIYNANVPLPQHALTAYYFHKQLDIHKMQEAAQHFLGKHDFYAFSSEGGNVKTSVRTLYSLDVTKEGSLIHIVVKGDGFLYNMVRIIVGTLIDIGCHKKVPEDIPQIIASRDRSRSGKKSPANGLTLVNIRY